MKYNGKRTLYWCDVVEIVDHPYYRIIPVNQAPEVYRLIEEVKNVLVIQTPETLRNLSDALAEVGG